MKILIAVLALLSMTGCAINLSDSADSRYDSVAITEEVRLEYRVYLPPQYETQPDREFPLLVYFHGGNGNHRTWGKVGGLGDRLREKMKNEEFGPFVVLAPSVGRFDVITNDAERVLFDEVIPNVQRSYRVNDRTVGFGHSMGGLSVLMLALRHPNTFDAVAAASPFAYDISPFAKEEQVEMFEETYDTGFFFGQWQNGIASKFDSREQFNEYSPFEQIRNLESACRVEFDLFLTSGTKDRMGLYPQNLRLHQALVAQGVPHEFVTQDGVGHTTIAMPRLYQWIHERSMPETGQVTGTAGGR